MLPQSHRDVGNLLVVGILELVCNPGKEDGFVLLHTESTLEDVNKWNGRRLSSVLNKSSQIPFNYFQERLSEAQVSRQKMHSS